MPKEYAGCYDNRIMSYVLLYMQRGMEHGAVLSCQLGWELEVAAVCGVVEERITAWCLAS
jgi:hypothetical protein